jgi:hypothetical protein
MPTVGRVIAGKYELASLLGRGSMGEVWLARHLSLGEDVALKLLTSLPSGDLEAPSTVAARFRFEAQAAAHLSRRTRHIVRVTDHGEEDGLAYLVMELLDGQTLEALLLRRGSFTRSEAPKFVAQIARALTEAHGAGVIHRDLKPANIFVTHDEDGVLLVKLLDFGIARTMHTHRVATIFATGPGLVFGTPGYMSPEQANPLSRLDHRCDLWALATVAYETLTNELPVAGAYTEELLGNLRAGRIVPVHERDPELPAGLGAFFARAFARNIDDRFENASELAQAFEHALSDQGIGEPAQPAAATLKGHTVLVTLPMKLRNRFDPHGPRRESGAKAWLVALAPAALLVGVAAVGVAWGARSGSPRFEHAAASVAGVTSAKSVEERSEPPLEGVVPVTEPAAPVAPDVPSVTLTTEEPVSPPGAIASVAPIAAAAPAPVRARPSGVAVRKAAESVASSRVAAAPASGAAQPSLTPTQAPPPASTSRPSPAVHKPVDRSEVL